ncbi:MAG: hypothetical protein L0241_03720 [Planctomycetia bacterium]|nr:hypothetical protein [Planctomycetia bacterium]
MFRRLPTIMPLFFAATVGLFALSSVLTAQPPVKPVPPTPGDTGVKRTQEENLKLFQRFSVDVLRLAQKWEKSDSPDDKERAKSLRAALKLIEERGVEKMFKELIEGLDNKNLTGTEFNKLFAGDQKLVKALEDILTILDTEDDAKRIRDEIIRLEKILAEVRRLKQEQANLLERTNNPNGDPNKIAEAQARLAKETQDLANQLAGKGNANTDGKPQEAKSDVKPESKPGDNAGANKPDAEGNKSDSKPGDGMGKGGGEPKPGDGMGMGGMGGEEKPADPNGGAAKPGDPNAGMPNPMGGEPKPAGGAGKPMGGGKGDGKPSAGQGSGGEGKPMDGGGMGGMGGGQPGGSKPGDSGNQGPQQPGQKDPAQENIQGAVPPQQEAEDNIRQRNPDEATKKQDKAIEQLEKAIAELEKKLKQLREKELAKLLSNLEERVNQMLRKQIEVKAATESIDKGIKASNGKPTNLDFQKSQTEAEKEGDIVTIAEKTLKLMEGEGSAVVFAGVLKEVKGDMEAIQKRLNGARVGEDTQQIEQDVIDQLKMMLEALKKAKQDLENKPSDPKPSDPNAQKQNQKLIDLLNELKLVRALQAQVNKRTIMYNKQDPGEQANDPIVQAELKQLAERQKVLEDMLHKIATAANQ